MNAITRLELNNIIKHFLGNLLVMITIVTCVLFIDREVFLFQDTLILSSIVLWFAIFKEVFYDVDLHKNIEVILATPLGMKDIIIGKLKYLFISWLLQLVILVMPLSIFYKSIRLDIETFIVIVSLLMFCICFTVSLGIGALMYMNKFKIVTTIIEAIVIFSVAMLVILDKRMLIYEVSILSLGLLWTSRAMFKNDKEKIINRSMKS